MEINNNTPTNILSISWIVAPQTKFVIVPGDSTPTYNAAAQIDANHTELRASGRDLDGKYSPQAKPVTKRQAMNKLSAQSRKRNDAMDLLQSMESW